MKMDALIMAGGEGKRLRSNVEKPLVKIDGKCLIDYVVEALKGSKIGKISASTSSKAPDTENYLRQIGIKQVRALGRGYVEDMIFALDALNLGKTLVISSDLPLIKSSDIDWVIDEYARQPNPALSIFVPLEIFEEHDIAPSIILDGCVPAGINIIDGKNLNGPETKLMTGKLEFALNVNTQKELELAKRRLKNDR